MLQKVRPFDHRVHIRDNSGRVIEERHFAHHIAQGTSYYNCPPLSDKFYTKEGEPIPFEDVPDVCKKNINKQVQAVPVKSIVGRESKATNKQGSSPDSDTPIF